MDESVVPRFLFLGADRPLIVAGPDLTALIKAYPLVGKFMAGGKLCLWFSKEAMEQHLVRFDQGIEWLLEQMEEAGFEPVSPIEAEPSILGWEGAIPGEDHARLLMNAWFNGRTIGQQVEILHSGFGTAVGWFRDEEELLPDGHFRD